MKKFNGKVAVVTGGTLALAAGSQARSLNTGREHS